jgi:hypothetical protein
MLNPERAEDPAFPDDAMGNGQFACYRRGPYLFAGGHAGVRDRIVEDVALARAVKWKGGKYRFRMGPSLTFTRMYTGFSSLWAGFRKNAAVVDPERPGLSVALTGAAILLIAQAELWPWVVGIAALLAHVGVPRLGPFGNPDNPLLSWMPVDLASLGLGPLNLLALAALGTAQLLAIYAGRFLLYREVCDAASGTRLSRNLLCYLGQPIGAVVGLAAMLNSLVSQLRGSTEWKGRRVRARSL